MYIIKRDGKQINFDIDKIISAITRANAEVEEKDRITEEQIISIADDINKIADTSLRALSVEEIQDLVEKHIFDLKAFELYRAYSTYRYKRALLRKGNNIDEAVMNIVACNNEEIKQENSNKDPEIIPTQRDYMAGEISKDLSERVLLPKDIVEAHKKGIIHFHDMDYFAQHSHNCCLVNLEDMLQNGTTISGTMIEKPHRFSTACNIATQIIAQVASSQYGGQTITLSHLAPFVDISRQKIRAKFLKDLQGIGINVANLSDDEKKKIDERIEEAVKEEINNGVQILQYQITTLMTTNGQAPFVTEFMYLNEVEEGSQTQKDLALIIEETLKQRIQGTKNEKGVWVTPAFPKLIYVLDENNITEDSEYWYLTELAAKCTAKRMVPDYISAKVQKELKGGNVYPCMGCVDGEEIITYKFNNNLFVESFVRMWFRLSMLFPVKHQYSDDNPNLYIDLQNVQIFDTKLESFTNCKRIIRNISDKWVDVNISGGRRILCTEDHPFETLNRGVVFAKDLNNQDQVLINYGQYSEENYVINPELAWTLGFIICDGAYQSNPSISIAAHDEDDIRDRYMNNFKDLFGFETKEILRERGVKGTYKDINAICSNTFNGFNNIKNYFSSIFGGINKNNRQIPNEVFTWNYGAKLAFLAGMIDADGYINNSAFENQGKHQNCVVQLGSTNKELALQQMSLAQTLGMQTKMYYNHYNTENPEAIRYRIEFVPSLDLLQFITCQKKKDKFLISPISFNNNYNAPIGNITGIRFINKPNYSYDVTTESEHFEVSGIYSHNCRSFLTYEPHITNDDGTPKFYSRFNQGVVTINLVDVACSSNKDINKFWEILEERLELCHRALRCKHERLLGTPSDVAPIMWQYGALARLKKGETIDKLLFDGYSTISLGYAGLYEMTKYMLGVSHTDEEKGRPFALSVMQRLNDKCKEWRAKENIGYSVYGTPIESVTYKFAKCLQDRFGIIEDVTDHNYITNSYHCVVRENIDAFSKLSFEAPFQKLSPGGAISYVETPNLQNNVPAILALLKHMYNTILYSEINTKSDYCMECGYDGEIEIAEDEHKKLIWRCPNCGNTDQDKMSVVRRTCGYLGSHFWNQGRTQEIKDRVLHL